MKEDYPYIIKNFLQLQVDQNLEAVDKSNLVSIDGEPLSHDTIDELLELMLQEELLELDDEKYHLTPFAYEVIESGEYELTQDQNSHHERKDIEESLVSFLEHVKNEWSPFKKFSAIFIVSLVLGSVLYFINKTKYDNQKQAEELQLEKAIEAIPIHIDEHGDTLM